MNVQVGLVPAARRAALAASLVLPLFACAQAPQSPSADAPQGPPPRVGGPMHGPGAGTGAGPGGWATPGNPGMHASMHGSAGNPGFAGGAGFGAGWGMRGLGSRFPYGMAPDSLRMRALHDALGLNDAQEKAWQAAAAEARTQLQRLAAERANVRPATGPAGNLRQQAEADDAAFDRMRAAMRSIREQWIRFDETLTPEQRAYVRGTMHASGTGAGGSGGFGPGGFGPAGFGPGGQGMGGYGMRAPGGGYGPGMGGYGPGRGPAPAAPAVPGSPAGSQPR
jgi:hypothetical protein